MKHRRMAGLVPLLVGALVLTRMAGNPRLAALHGADIVQMVAAGMCLGAGLGMLVQQFRRR